MNTIFLLFAEFNSIDVPLEMVAVKYLGMSKEVAFRHASAKSLPIPAFKPGHSQKCAWMVRITDLAAYLDGEHELAISEWEKTNNKNWLLRPLINSTKKSNKKKKDTKEDEPDDDDSR